jgi:hypothetical protein
MSMANDDKPRDARGTDRRTGKERRHGHDRSVEIRFELDKDDRRSGRDRRKQGGWDRIR